jgi:2-hydroxy-3-keto-5-methylthiopentenyl-1-phosphate phosphatase
METYLGRYLSFSCLAQETKGFKDQYFKGGLAKQSLSGLHRLTDTVAEQLQNLHKSVQEVIAKLLKNREVKDRVMEWLRKAVELNMDKQKMFT